MEQRQVYWEITEIFSLQTVDFSEKTVRNSFADAERNSKDAILSRLSFRITCRQ